MSSKSWFSVTSVVFLAACGQAADVPEPAPQLVSSPAGESVNSGPVREAPQPVAVPAPLVISVRDAESLGPPPRDRASELTAKEPSQYERAGGAEQAEPEAQK
jgi:hypothetical protein